MTDTAQLAILNDALFHLGQEPVGDLSEAAMEGSIAATKLMRVADQARDAVLARHGWTCALEYVKLAPGVIPNYDNFRYPTVFILPEACLHIWEVAGERCFRDELAAPETRWQFGTFETGQGARKIIRAAAQWWSGLQLSQLPVAYVRRAAWAALDPHVRDAISLNWAARAAWNVTSNGELMGRLKSQAEAQALLAISADGTQEGGQPPLMPDIPASLRARCR